MESSKSVDSRKQTIASGTVPWQLESQLYDLFFHAVVRCTQFKGTDKLHIIDDKTFGGTLVNQYEQALGWLQDKLKLEYEIKGTGALLKNSSELYRFCINPFANSNG